ncbi:uncharacterized protein N0V96_007645 [Colletotrichum fioriniae]|uniref:uncharacterized protein n=1 Tax=Colletotrichum fioriniae TaxID=710243 RepID=UPI0032DBD1CC|nr:hypothetical protein N0V96_007645 [Colletotrichum fioriniae]
MLREMLSQLTAMPDDVAHQTLKKLKFAVDPYAALRAIRPSGPRDAREILPHISSNVEFELTRRHPILYPQTRRLGRLEMPEDVDSRPSKVARVEDASEEGSILEDRRAPEYPTVAEILEDDSSTASPRPSRAFDSAFFVPPMGPIPPPTPRIRNEPRLKDLNIAFWTVVPISNQDAAEVISLYLETDHPILGLFDADLFLNDLVNGEVRYCSSLLVNALLAFACVSCPLFLLLRIMSLIVLTSKRMRQSNLKRLGGVKSWKTSRISSGMRKTMIPCLPLQL